MPRTPARFDNGITDIADARAVQRVPPPRRMESLAEQETRLDRTRARLEERYGRMVEAAPSAMILLNHAGEIETVNRRAEIILGTSRDDLLGRHVETLVPGAAALHHAALRRGYVAHSESHAVTNIDLMARRGDGGVFPVEIDLSTIETEDGPMVVAALTDVTHRREAGAARERQALDLAQSNADLQEFAYIASHDLRAPLRAISLLADWIAEDIQASAGSETLDNLRLMRQRAGRLEMLLDGLLTYSSIGHGKAPNETVELPGLVADIVDSLAPGPGFIVRFEGPVQSIATPRAPLEHVLQNLISNAIRHHDLAQGHVQVTARRLETGIEFAVRDDGPGIAPAFHKRIFAIFQTLISRDDCETSGVGLSIVQKTVESRGGRVWVESEPPRRGTIFRFTWPLA
jgi:PAS domain S-box-containing protein